tara:strand:+ start:213 stop:314 length:102 start_codon:yes stop_codon:yes gene_type:complete
MWLVATLKYIPMFKKEGESSLLVLYSIAGSGGS